VSRAALDKDPRDVASMFDGVARRYDLTNTVLSLGQDRNWRRATRGALRIGPGQKVLDLAAGTAVSTVELAKSGAWCVAADFSVGMLVAGGARPVPKVAGDATKLPFGDGVFDAVTISFGLRNVVDTLAGLREMARVTRPGGRLVVCAGGAGGVEQPRRLRVSRGVHQGLARPSDAGAADRPSRVDGSPLAQSDRRHRGVTRRA
jgi:demethylmenaquinone methyltransferase/2-methoxy-6-polyprenyl-1,4-benzoquinol methylase